MGYIRLNKTQIIDGLGEAHSFPLHGLSTALPFATAQAMEKFAAATVLELFIVIGPPPPSMTGLQFRNCSPAFVLSRYGERGYRSDKLSRKIPIKKLPRC